MYTYLWRGDETSGKYTAYMALRVIVSSVFKLPSRPVLTRALSAAHYPLRLSSVSDNHAAIYEESLKHPEHFWGDLARRRLRWMKKFNQVMHSDMDNGQFSWFGGGVLNVTGKLGDSRQGHIRKGPIYF